MKVIIFATSLLLAGTAIAANPRTTIVNEGYLGETHALASGTQLTTPGYPETYADSGDDVCIALGYTVKPDGTTGDFRLLRAWSSNRRNAEKSGRYLDTFASSAADAVSKWRFEPKNGDMTAINTVATLTFRGGKGTATAQGLADRCRIGDLTAHYKRLENGRVPVRRVTEQARDGAISSSIRQNEAFANSVFSRRP